MSKTILSFDMIQGLTITPQEEKDMQSLKDAIVNMFDIRIMITRTDGKTWVFEHNQEPQVIP